MLKLTASVLAALALSCATSGVQPAEDFDVEVEQLDARPIERNGILADMEFGITVTNHTEYPWRVDAVALKTVTSTHFTVPAQPRPWGQVIAPGHSNDFSFWTPVQAAVGFSKLTLPMRVRLDLVGPNGEKRTKTFTREMQAWLSPAQP
jgi:hypothetical protein